MTLTTDRTDADQWRTRFEIKAAEAAAADDAVELLTQRCYELAEALTALGHRPRELDMMLTEMGAASSRAAADAATGRSVVETVAAVASHAASQREQGTDPAAVLDSLLGRLGELGRATEVTYSRNRRDAHQHTQQRLQKIAALLNRDTQTPPTR